MKLPHYRIPSYESKNGQVLVLFLLFAVVLLLFVGLGIDLGFAYITKARLSKALDAASLAAVSNYSSSDNGVAATTLANNTFWANYGTNGVNGLNGGVQVQPHGQFTLDTTSGNLTFTNTASATINTFFIGLLPQWKTLTVGDTAVANRAPVAMTLVLDRTGSMAPGTLKNVGSCSPDTAGGLYLPGAVTQFISIFDENLDRAALVTFAVSSSNDVPMTAKGGAFKGPITNTINRINNNNLWAGGTCSIAGLTNALVIQKNLNVTPNVIKVVVFFTDGRANMTEGVIGGIPLNFGGDDPIQAGCPALNQPTGAGFYRTNAAETANAQTTPLCNATFCDTVPPCTLKNSSIVVGATWTNSAGVPKNFCALDITEDATNRCVLLSSQMRANSNYVYAVGLSAPGALAPPTLQMLQQMANDPDSPQFDPTQPVGAAFLSDGNDLSQVFQQVAADIILRLVR